jgi:hypothetical protein
MRGIVLCMLLGRLSAASDVSGLWTATYTLPGGQKHESTLDLQVEGGKLRGKITSSRGTVAIDEGAVSGEQVSFTVIRRGNGDELTVGFTGTVKGETMGLRMEYRDHDPVDMIAKRIKAGKQK